MCGRLQFILQYGMILFATCVTSSLVLYSISKPPYLNVRATSFQSNYAHNASHRSTELRTGHHEKYQSVSAFLIRQK